MYMYISYNYLCGFYLFKCYLGPFSYNTSSGKYVNSGDQRYWLTYPVVYLTSYSSFCQI